MIQVMTPKPSRLLQALVSAAETERLSTWGQDEEGDFTIMSGPFAKRAYFRAVKTSSGLRCNIIGITEEPMTQSLYAEYHARFVGILMEYFFNLFDEISATPLGTKSDLI